MSDFKNLKVPKHTHEALVRRADEMGMKVYTLADALLLDGLKKSATTIARVVADTQQEEVTPPAASTNPAQKRPKY
jgi:alkanesulfonate monooxygenase SsuD/methylene tetrahydromethanopterin reductase-like flavin-dependent oxidoreductase (luciferase family)